jgi:PAS domain S-box-containing protein
MKASEWWHRVDFGIILLDSNGKTLFVNDWVNRHARLQQEVLPGKFLQEIFSEPISPRLFSAIEQTLRRRHSSRLSSALHPSPLPLFSRHADTARMRHAVDVVSVMGVDEQQQCLLQIRDMSESIRREDLLRQQANQLKNSQGRLNAILDHAPIGMALSSPAGYWTYVNQALCEILCSPPQLLTGQPSRNHINPSDWASHQDFENAVMQGGHSGAHIEERWTDRNGNSVWVRLTATRLVDATLSSPSLILQIEPIGDRKQKENVIAAALTEKETLLREVYHRVKNNLQVIQSLLNLKRRNIVDEPARQALSETADRVRAMALVHEKLYQSQHLSAIDLANYMVDLVDQLEKALGTNSQGVSVSVTADPIQADLTTAIPFGLILTELLTNSLKHAFPNLRRGAVQISLKKLEGSAALLRVADDGVGLATSPGQALKHSLGLTMVNSLARQLDATVRLDAEQKQGVCFEIWIPQMSRHPRPSIS